jgi:hypothetical protein
LQASQIVFPRGTWNSTELDHSATGSNTSPSEAKEFRFARGGSR